MSGFKVLVATVLSVSLFAASAAKANPASKPMITPNRDGTFTIQKEPANGNSKDSKSNQGFVIPPQIVVPFTLPPEKKQNSSPHQKSQ